MLFNGNRRPQCSRVERCRGKGVEVRKDRGAGFLWWGPGADKGNGGQASFRGEKGKARPFNVELGMCAGGLRKKG